MININVKNDSFEEFDKACKKFKKICTKDGFLKEVRERRYFKKPSQIKHENNIAKKRRNK